MNPKEKFKLLIGKYLVYIALGVSGIVGSVLLFMFFFCLIGIFAGEPGTFGMAARTLIGAAVCGMLAAVCAAWLEACGYLNKAEEENGR